MYVVDRSVRFEVLYVQTRRANLYKILEGRKA